MLKTTAIAKYELLRYFTSPLAYVYLIAFLLMNGSFAVYFGHFFERGQADLESMFAFQPWIYLLFIPGISMRLWAEEFRSRTIVQIAAMPVSITQLVVGKFLAAWTFVAIALALTFPFWITVNILGSPDNAVIAMGYAASLALAACMLAVSQAMSALTKNQVIALVLAVAANLIFFLSGVEFVLALVRPIASAEIADMVASFSFLAHFETLSQGLLEPRDLVFFASLVALFLLAAALAVGFRTAGTSAWLRSDKPAAGTLAFACLLAGFVGLNLAADAWGRAPRWDATRARRFELSSTSRDVLRTLREPVEATLYYSKILETRNPEFRRAFDEARLKLGEFQKAGGGRFTYKIRHPEFLDSDEDMAVALGLQPIPLVDEGLSAYFGVAFSNQADDKGAIPLLALERRGFAEQDLISKIYTLGRKKKTVGILTSLPLFDTALDDGYIAPRWAALDAISEFYNVRSIEKPEDFGDIDSLMIVHPLGLAPEMVEAIGAYAAAGKNALILLDPAAEAPRLYLPVGVGLTPSDAAPLEKIFGFRFKAEAVVADLENSIAVDLTRNYKKSPSYSQDVLQFKLGRRNFNPEMPEVNGLENILFASAASIEPSPEAKDSVVFLPLVNTGAESAYFAASEVYRAVSPAVLLENFKPDGRPKTVAARLISRTQGWQAIVVADTDFLYDSFWSKTVRVLDSNYTVPLFDNVNFVLNALEILNGDPYLGGIRRSSADDAPFEGIEKLRKQSEQEFRIKEAAIFRQIDAARKKMAEVLGKRGFEGREAFTADELAVVANVRRQLDGYRQDLAKIRAGQKSAVEAIALAVKFANIALVPLLLLLALAGYALLKKLSLCPSPSQGEARRGHQNKLSFSKPLSIAAAISLALLALGLFAARPQGREASLGAAFPGLEEKLPQVEKITLENKTGKLVFVLGADGQWKLEDSEFPVYQARIRRFLAELAHAKRLTRKSARPDLAGRFGFYPPEAATRVELAQAGNAGKPLEAFAIGRYDMDLGRGGKSAYIRSGGEAGTGTEIWQIEADFVDLSLDWHDWTFSSLWNLRFGRLQAAPGQDAELVRDLLNTPLLAAPQKLPATAMPQKSLDLAAEDDSLVRLDFFTDKKDKEEAFACYKFVQVNNPGLQTFANFADGRCFAIGEP